MKMNKIEKLFVNTKKHAQYNIRILDQLLSHIDLSKTQRILLEIGCGIGLLSSHLSDKYQINVTGTDVDPEQIELAKEYNKENENLRFLEADAVKLPFNDNHFGMVVSYNVLHHTGLWNEALQEIRRVLQLQGIFILSDFIVSRFIKRILKTIVKKSRFVSRDELINLLRENNFKIIYERKPQGIFLKQYSMVLQKN